MVYGSVHARSVSDMIELRFLFEQIKDRKDKEDREAGLTAPETTNRLSAITFKLDK